MASWIINSYQESNHCKGAFFAIEFDFFKDASLSCQGQKTYFCVLGKFRGNRFAIDVFLEAAHDTI